ncbi:MarR family transcriptional regulator [Candidatus Woesearchaeota archaeon]|nr:MarR family transcriptional regulator [Candidatus Woesearchaeota archaeon]
MSTQVIYEYLERVANLIRTDMRRSGMVHGLQPIQLEALHYLGRCNRYSNNPMAVAEFLGLTKGTVSQTLNLLETSGLIERRLDPKDKRRVHLTLTPNGQRVIAETVPPECLNKALAEASPALATETLALLKELLRQLQRANGLKSFGACKTCRHHAIHDNDSRQCLLTGEALTDRDAELLCREHTILT